MATELELNTPAAEALQSAVQSKLVELEWATGQEDQALAEYIMLSVASGKPQAEISAELANDFLGLDPNDSNVVGFVGWLVQQVDATSNGANGGPEPTSQQQAQSDGSNAAAQDADMDDATSSAADGSIPTGPKSMRNGGKTRARHRSNVWCKKGLCLNDSSCCIQDVVACHVKTRDKKPEHV